MSTDLTTTTPAPAPDAGALDLHRPDLNEWARNLQAAHTIGSALCTTSFAPAHFRGKPEEAAAAILYGSEVGFTPTQALQNLYVIGGKPALYARPMVAIVQAAGHEVWTVAKSDESVTVAGRRRGSEHTIEETWTVDRAKRAGYTNNKKYQTDPQAMLYARAASDVCRQIAADALAGMAFSVEELEMAQPAPTAAPRGLDAVRAAVTPVEDRHNAPAVNDEQTAIPEDEPVQATIEPDEPMLTDRTRKTMFALIGEIDPGADDDAQRAGIAHIIGRPVESRKSLTEAEGQQVVDHLRAVKRQREIAAVQAGGA